MSLSNPVLVRELIEKAGDVSTLHRALANTTPTRPGLLLRLLGFPERRTHEDLLKQIEQLKNLQPK